MKTPGIKTFVHGTTYYHFANPSEEFTENFRKIKDSGLNFVRVAEIWPGWEVIEPDPGIFKFEELDEYVAKAHGEGLGVIMGIGVNNPPFWVFEELPDVRCIGTGGDAAVRRVQSANHDHREYRALMRRFIEAVVRRYKDVPGVKAWQFGNEIRYGVEIADNDCSRERFRSWLKKEFQGDLSGLNKAWGVHYRSWEEIYPYESLSGAPTQGLSPLAIASRRFQAWSIEELINWAAKIIRSESELPLFHNNFGISGPNGSHWRINLNCDLVVQDIYPSVTSNPQVYNAFLLDCACSMARSQKKDFWVGETSIGQYGTFHRDRPKQALIETLVIDMIGSGAKGVLYFRHKSPKFEQPHKFTGSQGSYRRDGSALSYEKTILAVRDLISSSRSRIMDAAQFLPQVAVYYPEESYLFSKTAGYEALQQDACFGASGLWNALGFPIHIMPTEALCNEDISKFRVIYLPVSFLLPSSLGRRLVKYVKEGGVLISEARPGYVDEDGWLYKEQPGAGVAEAFGAYEDVFWNEPAVKINSAFGHAEFTDVFQSFRLKTARALAHNDVGDVMAVENFLGNGRAVLLGFAPSLLFSAGGGKYANNDTSRFSPEKQSDALAILKGILSGTEIKKPVTLAPSHNQFTVRYLESENEVFVFLMNYGPPGSVEFPPAFNVINSGGEEAHRAEKGSIVKLKSYSWVILAAGKDAVS